MREIDTGAQEAFIKEVNEDLKNESMKKMWDKYGLYIIILVVAALTAAVSFEAIKAWYTKKLQTWSDSYAYALSLAERHLRLYRRQRLRHILRPCQNAEGKHSA